MLQRQPLQRLRQWRLQAPLLPLQHQFQLISRQLYTQRLACRMQLLQLSALLLMLLLCTCHNHPLRKRPLLRPSQPASMKQLPQKLLHPCWPRCPSSQLPRLPRLPISSLQIQTKLLLLCRLHLPSSQQHLLPRLPASRMCCGQLSLLPACLSHRQWLRHIQLALSQQPPLQTCQQLQTLHQLRLLLLWTHQSSHLESSKQLLVRRHPL